jgi:hypothetical protein
MFKKRVIRKPPQQRRKESEDDKEEEDDDDEENVRQHLEVTKKRRKLLESMQYKHGVDASELLSASSSADKGKKKDNNTMTTKPTNNSEGQSVWDQKHAAAMEEFVRSKLQTSVDGGNTANQNHEETTSPSALTTKTDLYRELAQQLSSATSASTRDVPDTTASTTPVAAAAASSKDVLRAGAATALSEVILPAQDRIETMTQTQHAMHMPKKSSSSSSNKGILPIALPTSTTIPAAAATASAAVSFPHRFQSTKQRTTDTSTVHSNPDISKYENKHGDYDYDGDNDRIGFQAVLVRSQQQHDGGSHRTSSSSTRSSTFQKPQRASDDRVYKEFIKRQHQQRK